MEATQMSPEVFYVYTSDCSKLLDKVVATSPQKAVSIVEMRIREGLLNYNNGTRDVNFHPLRMPREFRQLVVSSNSLRAAAAQDEADWPEKLRWLRGYWASIAPQHNTLQLAEAH